MAQFVIANNVNTQLAAALPASGAGSTTAVLASSANLPTLNTATGQMMPLTLNDAATGAIYETVYVTAISGATLTVLRGQEGTSALNWNVGDFALCGPTAGTSGLTTMRTQYQASATFSSSQTLTAAIAGESIGFTGSSAATFSMPGQSTVPALTPTAVYNDGSAALTLTANGSDKFVVATGQVTSIVMQPGDDLSFYASATSGQWQATAGSALRQYEPLVIGAATASQHAVQFGQIGTQATALGFFKSVKRQVIASSSTYTPSTNMVYCDVELIGGGGGGGGSQGGASAGAAGGGGGAGGYVKKLFTAATIGASVSVTIGAAGSSSGAAGVAGGNGGASTFLTLSAGGGTGGAGGLSTSNVSSNAAGGAGGTASGGDINVQGQPGIAGIVYGANGGLGGSGGTGIYGAGGQQAFPSGAGGNAGNGKGSGGSGASSLTTNFASGVGTAGLCIVTEYCSS